MFSGLKKFLRERAQAHAFKALPPEARELVFYSEGPGYWTHFEPMVRRLVGEYNRRLCYLTSRWDDPILRMAPPGVLPFCIGEGTVRTMMFAGLEAGMVVMTMPDLETFHIKRSSRVRHYAYIHHSIVSCHMVYQPAAFDHFDSIFCVGSHHVREIRAREKQLGLPAKHLVEHGYGRLDLMIDEFASMRPGAREAGSAPRILIAPSWGPDALLERHGGGFMAPLIDAGFHVTLRPHPQTRRLNPGVLGAILERFGSHPRFSFDEDMNSKRSLLEADLMVSDWSGAALEFAFGRLKPVLFVDVPRKVNNPDYESLGIEPIEVSIRSEVGVVIPESELDRLGARASEVLSRIGGSDIALARERSVFNVGRSGAAGAAAIERIIRGK